MNRLKDHHPETIIEREQAEQYVSLCEDVAPNSFEIRQLIDGFVEMARMIVNNAGSEAQATERVGNLTVNFVREYNSIMGE